ncbi:hypothetical protein BDY19DRAFT_109991 [Irpex rosettiformis]|uniref:Uncharacterized protein n=1 Tax=Irpex rosettiformis TaxID=378272 RepID=A0ACB8U5T5_9APHY|nr:hypothetical protein BDY19DRAFT_109991 [Irpex rosettiformis]
MAMVNGSTSRIPSTDAKPKASSSPGEGTTLGKKPTITISAPPSTRDVEEDKDIFNAPRAAPAPPSTVSSSSTSPSRTSRASKEAHGVARKFGFGNHRKDREEHSMSDPERSTKGKARASTISSPTPSVSPMLPPKMHFPIPPKSSFSAHTGAQIVPTLTDAFQSLSPATSSLATVSPHTATASDMSDNDLSPTSPKGTETSLSRPPRPTSLIIPTGTRSRTNSANTISSTLTAKSPPSSPSSPTPTHNRSAFPPSSSRIRGASNASVNRAATQHYSYSARMTNSVAATPASPPPLSPLPSPPVIMASFPGSGTGALSSGEEVEVEAGWSTDASTRLGHGGWSTDASTRVGSLGGSYGKKGGEGRVRANTITTTATANGSSAPHQPHNRSGTSVRHQHHQHQHPLPVSTYRQHASGVSSGEETNYESAASGRSVLAGRKKTIGALAMTTGSKGDNNDSSGSVVGRSQGPSQQDLPALVPPLSSSSTVQARHDESNDSTTPTKEEGNAASSGLRVAHETFVRILQEKHAAEKAELVRRIERREREARKREREIKDLRWLVMNPNGGATGAAAGEHPGGTVGQPYVALLALEEQLAVGRLRSGSKSSEVTTHTHTHTHIHCHSSSLLSFRFLLSFLELPLGPLAYHYGRISFDVFLTLLS